MADVKELNINNTTYAIKDAVARNGLTTKQDILVSGTNIKTINNQSILGSGNITINEPILYSTTGQNTDGAMTQKATTDELNTRIDYSQVAGSHILSAPNGIAEIVNGNLVAKAGLKLLIADGLNADGTYNNYIYTFEEDTVLRENYVPNSVYYIQGVWFNEGQTSRFDDIDVSGSQCKNYTHGLYANLPTVGRQTLMYYATDQNKYYCNIPSASTGWFEMKQCFLFYTTNSTIYEYEQIYRPVSPSQIDGVWNNAQITLASDVAIPTSSNHTYDLSSYLPNNKYDYEVLFNGTAATTATNGSVLELRVGSDITRPIFICGARTRATANTFTTGNAIIRVGKERTCYVIANKSWTGTFRLYAASYRRLGTNA